MQSFQVLLSLVEPKSQRKFALRQREKCLVLVKRPKLNIYQFYFHHHCAKALHLTFPFIPAVGSKFVTMDLAKRLSLPWVSYSSVVEHLKNQPDGPWFHSYWEHSKVSSSDYICVIHWIHHLSGMKMHDGWIYWSNVLIEAIRGRGRSPTRQII